ncbi:hypothetical protein PEBR_17387 [Penicillium brasilianum]|uniref:MARVEL domain-containing protein n=1 Tax=Penicillium brasilianum TaxID=104259 RepID=A0A1S9RPJ0_PENBI|nr:hypothetical protein PEBR_17387 [Penicillium brasilianum]
MSSNPNLTDAQVRFFLLCDRVIQWLSTVIVLGINSYLVNVGPRGLFITYMEIVAVVSVVVFLPAFASPFLSTPFKDFVLFIDVIFSYLWLTAFIFSAVDYNKNNCHLNAPPGVACSKKWALEAFIFLTFIFTFFALFIEAFSLWAHRRNHLEGHSLGEKRNGSHPFNSSRVPAGDTEEQGINPTAEPRATAAVESV